MFTAKIIHLEKFNWNNPTRNMRKEKSYGHRDYF